MRGASAHERWAVQHASSAYGSSSSTRRDPSVAPTVRPWSRQVQDLMRSSGHKFRGELLYGVHPVLCALQASRRPEFFHLYLQDNKAARLAGRLQGQPPSDLRAQNEIVALAKKKDIPISYLSKHDLHLLSEQRPHNGFALDTAPLQPPIVFSAYDLQAHMTRWEAEAAAVESDPQLARSLGYTPPRGAGQVWVLLDEIMDPQNLGAMLRSCLYLSVSGVLLCGKNSAALGATTSKASSGAQEFLPILLADSTPRLVHKMDRQQWNVVGLTLSEHAVDMRQLVQCIGRASAGNAAESGAPVKHTLLVVGNEGRGLRPVVANACDMLAKIEGAPSGGSGAALLQPFSSSEPPDTHAEESSSSSSSRPASLAADNFANEDELARSNELAREADRVNAEEEAEAAQFVSKLQRPTPSTPRGPVARKFVDSLNVSNALAVALYELSRHTSA